MPTLTTYETKKLARMREKLRCNLSALCGEDTKGAVENWYDFELCLIFEILDRFKIGNSSHKTLICEGKGPPYELHESGRLVETVCLTDND